MKSDQKSLLGPKRKIHRTDQRTTLPRKTRSSKPMTVVGESCEPILPIDLMIEIFSRLPAKSIARFRCLSKLWASGFSHPHFTELFLKRASTHPQLLFTILKGKELYFYSIPQLQNHDGSVMATYVTKTSLASVCHSNGLVFLKDVGKNTEFLAKVCNPSTGKFLMIPKLSRRRDCFLGYDPIGKQYKLLSMAIKTYKVLTLGSEKMSWRKINCGREHRHRFNPICIEGVLYYRAKSNEVYLIVSFDIRSEEFQFMEATEKFSKGTYLINYNGKLGSVMWDGKDHVLEIWVLEDLKKQEWSKHIHVLPPPLWKDDTQFISVVGIIATDVIVFEPVRRSNGTIYVLYYNMKTKSFVNVEIKGIEGGMWTPWTYLNHVEDLKLLV